MTVRVVSTSSLGAKLNVLQRRSQASSSSSSNSSSSSLLLACAYWVCWSPGRVCTSVSVLVEWRPVRGAAYVVVGAICLALALAFFIKDRVSPRDFTGKPHANKGGDDK